ncbi:hypothetical protein [Pseudoduganella sp. GCM10020061]|uniref:hypothetical protein n=1 Tax=Pseudoduganella sp. GCM10020061 TaxID=3317345 RepID=UPI003636DCD6
MTKFLFCFALAISAPVFAAGQSKPVTPELAQQREARKAEIEQWTTRYDGYELKSGEFACRTPRIPQISKDNAEITAVGERVTKWQHCYNRFVDNLNKKEAPEARIPKDVFALMTPEEREKAIARIKAAQAEVGLTASVKAKTIMADYDAWRVATDAWVKDHNETTKHIQEEYGGDRVRRPTTIPSAGH